MIEKVIHYSITGILILAVAYIIIFKTETLKSTQVSYLITGIVYVILKQSFELIKEGKNGHIKNT